jgi:hypothetical protein
MGVLEHKRCFIWIYIKNPRWHACWMCWSYFDFLTLFLGRFFMNDICCLFIVVGSSSHEGHGHDLCHIIEGLDHVFLHVVCSFIYGYQVFNSFILQHQVCGINSINGLHQHLIPMFCRFSHVIMSRKVSPFHPCACNKLNLLFTLVLATNWTSCVFWNCAVLFSEFGVEG